MPERMVHLALSQKAARLLGSLIAEAGVNRQPRDQEIVKAIHRDLYEQIEQPKKGKKRGN